MHMRNRNKKPRRKPTGDVGTNKKSATSVAEPPKETVPEVYQVVIECRHEREQRAVFERMRGEGYRCRVLTL